VALRIVIVGGGFAGLSTAWQLARRRAGSILLLEKEASCGVHASGRNAGLLRQSCDDPEVAALLRNGLRAAKRALRRVPGALSESGSLILGPLADALDAGPRARHVDAGDVVPGLKGRALFDPDDALADPAALLGLLERAARRRGVEIRFGVEVERIGAAGGAVREVFTRAGAIAADRVVIAAGAWAAPLAQGTGSEGAPLVPYRRHLFRGRVEGRALAAMPFLWDEGRGVYARPEGDGALLSPCDQEAHPPGPPVFDASKREILAERLADAFGTLGAWSLGPGWACLRTRAPDGRFVIGPDPAARGLFWMAGLGGHGFTAAIPVGRLAARVFLGRASAGPFDPRRFAAARGEP
jgi:D-arginine dehydrogenase